MTYSAVLVCNGNVQRSPSGHAVLAYTVAERRLPLTISSGGVEVERAMANAFSPKQCVRGIETGLMYGVVPAYLVEAAQRAAALTESPLESLDGVSLAALVRLNGIVRPLVRERNIRLRNQALSDFGIPYHYHPPGFSPLKPEANPHYILPVEQGALDKVRSRYKNASAGEKIEIDLLRPDTEQRKVVVSSTAQVTVPQIEGYWELIGGQELADVIGGGIIGARIQVEYFLDTRNNALDALMKRISR